MSQTETSIMQLDVLVLQQDSTSSGRVARDVKPASGRTSPALAEEERQTQHDRRNPDVPLGRVRRIAIITSLAGLGCLNTLGSGILTISLPRMAQDLKLSEGLLLWPASVYALSAGCLLILFGNIADLLGAKTVWLIGSILFLFLTLACGLAQTAIQLIAFRACLGVAIAMCLPTAFSLVVRSFERGQWRNVSFACLGMGQPLGYSIGLILGGVFTDTIGWRYGYYISAILNAVLAAVAAWALPATPPRPSWKAALIRETDWIGVGIISASLGLLSYFLATISQSYSNIGHAANIAILVIALLLLPTFVAWMYYREKAGKSAIIPNHLWKNAVFSTVCGVVFLSWGVFNAFQYFSSLFFQLVQHDTALQTSLRFLPMVIVGAATNIVTGFVVTKVRPRTMIFLSAIITSAAPVIMAFSQANWIFWAGPFISMLIIPLHPDILFTISNLVISEAYPGESQSLAGAIFNTVSQIGNSVGLAVTAAIASSVTAHDPATSLLKGYHAAYWTMFACMVVVILLSWFGLKHGGKVGGKES